MTKSAMNTEKKELKRLRLPSLQLQQKHNTLNKKNTLASSPMEAAFL
jgi:hypothetical protein